MSSKASSRIRPIHDEVCARIERFDPIARLARRRPDPLADRRRRRQSRISHRRQPTMIIFNARLQIERLGARGEGVANGTRGGRFGALCAARRNDHRRSRRRARKAGRGQDAEPRPHRAVFAAIFRSCGGCAVQTLALRAYAEWKRGLLAEALRRPALRGQASKHCVDAHGEGRRRATFHARIGRRRRDPHAVSWRRERIQSSRSTNAPC